MATSKTLKPTGVSISIPAFTDAPDQRVTSNCIDKLADAVNTPAVKYEDTTITTGSTGNANLGAAYSLDSRAIIGIFNDRTDTDYETAATYFTVFTRSGYASTNGNVAVRATDVSTGSAAANKNFKVRIFYLPVSL